MTSLKYRVIGAAFDILSFTGASRLIRRFSKARGVIFTLHRVLPEPPAEFSPNAILQITPEFLEAVITRVRALGFEWVNIDEALERVNSNLPHKPFAVLTFDDAYRDNLKHALPILRRHQCPFTLYVPTAFVDGKGEIWWQALEDIIAKTDELTANGETMPTASVEQKRAAFDTIYWQMRTMPEEERVRLIHQLASTYDFNLFAHCRDLIMGWDELNIFVNEPLCTIGAHTVNHYELSKLSNDTARAEMVNSISFLRQRTGIEPRHLSYPIGSRRAVGEREYGLAKAIGLKSAVTTIPGGLYAQDRENMHALPRISLNGYYQKKRYIDVFLTGALFSFLGGRLG
jgi:peptidoglycan/xylan/chitin deacetylase (PgdA/CDA1 family)